MRRLYELMHDWEGFDLVFYARTKEGRPPEEWQLLRDHLVNVSQRATVFAEPFGGQELARVVGLAHDAGKVSDDFQQRLLGMKQSVDHSTAGGQIVNSLDPMLGSLLAYCIMGHHSAMPNKGSNNQPGSLADRLQREVPDYSAFTQVVELPKVLQLPWMPPGRHPGFSYAFLARMLFSCLVDADRLDAEAFSDLDKALKRGSFPSLQELAKRMEKHMASITADAADTLVNKERAHVLHCCREAAERQPGLFTLTVPTGGGKTLASLDFALKHAIRHGFRRVIYAIPFTSIVEQTARVFRDALGDEAILEHHSNYSFDSEDDSVTRLATENWDAPVIVTTNVQLFESLFSNKPSQCRKLHNIAESVIVLDEAQTIPDELLRPCLAALEELTLRYRVSVVLCTATQPELTGLWPMNSQPREIIPDPQRLFLSLKRVDVEYRGTMSDQEVHTALLEEEQALCIVNTRRHAAALFALLGVSEGHYHLSARMCPVHRKIQIAEIRQRLKEGKTCRVISTQLIEAGVDVDFPLVYRAVAGIDSIAQAAGRCNREGRQGIGYTYVFEPELGVPRGWFRRMAELGRRVMEEVEDPLSPEAIRRFFIRRFDLDGSGLDKHKILQGLESEWKTLSFPFKDIADSFKMIDDFSQSIIIPFDQEACDLLAEVAEAEHPGIYQRQLQRYTIGIHPKEFADYLQRGWLRQVRDIYYVLDYEQGYDKHVGLRTLDSALSDFLMA